MELFPLILKGARASTERSVNDTTLFQPGSLGGQAVLLQHPSLGLTGQRQLVIAPSGVLLVVVAWGLW